VFSAIDLSSCTVNFYLFMVFNILLYVGTRKHNILRLAAVISLYTCGNKCLDTFPNTQYMIDAHDPILMSSIRAMESPIRMPVMFLFMYSRRFTMSLRLQSSPCTLNKDVPNSRDS
jgi:hypothetical protein